MSLSLALPVAYSLSLSVLAPGCSETAWPEVKPAPRPPAAPGGPKAGGAAPVPAAPTEVPQVEVPAEAVEALRPLLAAYDKAHAALTGDTLDGVADSGRAMAEAARTARTHIKEQTLAALLVDVEAKGRKLGEGDIEAVRLTFGELSKSLLGLVSAIAPLREGRFVFECPMARGYQKWLQREPNLRNPYFGASMLTCGDEGRWAP
jgi:Cu(I)/Ag(I) efflux system membrane fusion protein